MRRIGLLGPAASEKMLARIIPVLEHPDKSGVVDWQTALFLVRDLGPSAQKAMPALIAFGAIDTWKQWDVRWAKTYAEEALRSVKLLENSDYDPLCRCAYLNTPPQVKEMQLTCTQGKSVTAKLDCHDPDDFERSLEVKVITQPAHGKVTVTGLSMEYQAHADYAGKDSFTWKASDPTDDSATATVSIQVTADPAAKAK